MDKKQALEKSIEKWEAIVAGTGVDEGAWNCALCQLYFWDTNCLNCPVYEKMGETVCRRTPYFQWSHHHHTVHSYWAPSFEVQCKTCQQLAEDELNFLRSL